MTIRMAFLAGTVAALALLPAAALLTATTTGTAIAKGGGGGGSGGDGGNGGGNSGGNGGGNSGGNGNGGSNGSSSGNSKSDYAPGKSGQRSGEATKSASKAASNSAKADGSSKVAGKGNVASDLKGLNAAHASLQAYANADPESRVGRIAAYREALLALDAVAEDPARAAVLEAYLDSLGSFAPDATEAELAAALDALQDLDDEHVITDDDIREALLDLNPDASDQDLDLAVAELAGVAESDNELDALDEDVQAALEAATGGIELIEGTKAWDRFHELMRLDEPLPAPTVGDDADEAALLEEVDAALADH